MPEQFRHGQAQFVGSLREPAQSVAVAIESGLDAEQRLQVFREAHVERICNEPVARDLPGLLRCATPILRLGQSRLSNLHFARCGCSGQMCEAQRIVDGRATPLFVSLDAVARDLLGRGPHGSEFFGEPRKPVCDFG